MNFKIGPVLLVPYSRWSNNVHSHCLLSVSQQPSVACSVDLHMVGCSQAVVFVESMLYFTRTRSCVFVVLVQMGWLLGSRMLSNPFSYSLVQPASPLGGWDLVTPHCADWPPPREAPQEGRPSPKEPLTLSVWEGHPCWVSSWKNLHQVRVGPLRNI